MLPSKSYLIRESYRKLPAQWFWTWMTGKELHDRLDTHVTTPTDILLEAFWMLGGGMLGCYWAWMNAPLLVPVFWILTVGGVRNLVATVAHSAVHELMFKTVFMNRLAAEVIGVTLFTQGFKSYRADHMYSHHSHNFGTFKDRDGNAIYQVGFRPGKTRSQLWQTLGLLLISPKFHFVFLKARFKENFLTDKKLRTLAATLWWIAMAGIAWQIGFGLFAVIYLIPVMIIYQMSSIMQLLIEHFWLGRLPDDSTGVTHAKLSIGRFCGSMAPETGNLGDWSRWWLAQFFYHLPTRIFVLQGAFPAHDWHHRHGGSKMWANSVREREKDILAMTNAEPYQDYWGYINIVNAVFDRIAVIEQKEPAGDGSLRLN